MGTQLQALWMSAHAPSSEHDHERWKQVPLRLPVSLPAQPDPKKSRTPPHNAHAGMLQVIPHPRSAPSVLRECIHAPPNGNEDAVEKLLTSSRALEPHLPHHQYDRENDSVCNKRTPHDEVRRALAQMIASAKSQRRNSSKEHLHPTRHGECLPQHPVRPDHVSTYAAMDTLFEMQAQVCAQHHLGDQHEHQPIRKRGVDIGVELAAAVSVTEEVPDDSENDSQSLDGDVPPRADHAQDHACGEEDAKGEDLDQDVDPEDGVEGFGGDGFAFGDFVGVVFMGECPLPYYC